MYSKTGFSHYVYAFSLQSLFLPRPLTSAQPPMTIPGSTAEPGPQARGIPRPATSKSSPTCSIKRLSEGAKEITIALSDLHGRTVLTGRRSGNAILDEQQAFSMRPTQRGLPPGTYLLTVRIKNGVGAIMKLESKVTAVN